MRRLLLLFPFAVIILPPAHGANADSTLTNLSLTARVLGADGQPCKASVRFWRAVASDGRPGRVDDFRDVSQPASWWHDPATGKTWQPLHNYGAGEGPTTEDKLTPGDYRVTAVLGYGPVPFGISQVIHLNGTRLHLWAGVYPGRGVRKLRPASPLRSEPSEWSLGVE